MLAIAEVRSSRVVAPDTYDRTTAVLPVGKIRVRAGYGLVLPDILYSLCTKNMKTRLGEKVFMDRHTTKYWHRKMCMINMPLDNFGIKHLFTGVFLDLELHVLC